MKAPKRRGIEGLLTLLMAEEPVVALQGPRSVGKSTLLNVLAAAHGAQVFDLDELATRDAVAADPVTTASARSPVLIDEYQRVPDVLDAIKAELNRDLRPGRFVLTGSTRHDALPAAAQALTGRLHVLAVLPFSQGEIVGVPEDFVDRLMNDPAATLADSLTRGLSQSTRGDYIRRVVVGGFPLAVGRSDSSRARWFDEYIRLTLERDALELRRLRLRAQLPRLFEALAAQTAQVLNMAAAGNRAGLEERTGEEYVKLLEALFLVHRLPAWGTTLRARAAARPKVHVVDSGVAARLLRLTPDRLARLDPTSQTQFGHLLESFAVGEVIKQLSWREQVTHTGHWRTHDGDEVDLIVEREDGGIVAFEFKAGRRVTGPDFTAMTKLRDALGSQFVAGIVFFLGERGYEYHDRLFTLPLDRLWDPPA